MQLLFDFDGTLNDITDKYYHCYVDCITEIGGTPLDTSAYSQLKRCKAPNATVLKKSGVDSDKAPIYSSLFQSRIELPKYLAYDHAFDFAAPVLSSLASQGYELSICSARNNTELGMEQLSKFGLVPFFTRIDIARHDPDVRKSKCMAIRRSIKTDTIWYGIGDTEDDINSVSDTHGVPIAVLSGLRDASTISALAHPAHVIEDIRSLPKLLDFAAQHG